MRRYPNVRRHGRGWIAVVQVEGRRHYSRTFATPREAAEYARAYRDASLPEQLWTLQQAWEALQDELHALQRAQGTLSHYRGHWPALASHFGADRLVHEIDEALVRLFVAKQSEQGAGPTTVHRRVRLLGRILGVAVQAGAMPASPVSKVRLPSIRQKRFAALTAEKVSEIVARIRAWPARTRGRRKNDRDADVVALLFLTGLRRSELARLRPEDIDLANARLFVRGKTENRELPVSDAAREVLDRLLAGAAPGKPLIGSAAVIAALIGQWRKNLGERELSAHVLRHSFATSLARAGVSVYVLRDLMGHRHLQQTMRYYHSQSDQNREAVGRLQLPPPPQPGAAPHGARGPGTGSRSGPAATR